jgi:hypothetical protein
MFKNILTEQLTEQYIKNKLFDPWKNTPFEGYVYLSPASKGSFGEKFVEKYLEQKGYFVRDRDNKGHDRVINGIKSEIKFSLSKLKKFVLNHISIEKDWDRMIFCCVTEKEEEIILYWFSKEDFIKSVKDNKIFKNQQGGKSINNDDYMCDETILNSPFIKVMEEW